MSLLVMIYELDTNGYKLEMLDILSIFSIICALCVIINKNPILSILFLLGLFGGISCYLILIGLTFIALTYLIVYIGAVAVLFLFILMLIDIRTSELENNNNNSLFLSIIIGILFTSSMLKIDNVNITNNDISYANSNDWLGSVIDNNYIFNIGNILYTNYNIWLIITGYILLLAMIGVIVIVLER